MSPKHQVPNSPGGIDEIAKVIMSTEEVANRLDLSVARIHALVRDHRLVPIQGKGKSFLFLRDQVEAFSKIERPNGRPKKTA